MAQARRLLFARKLIAETRLRLSDIAFAAGFSSIRRFNEAMREAHGEAPSMMRRRAGVKAEGDTVRLRLGYRPPFDWEGLIWFLEPRAAAGVEEVSGGSYARAFELDSTAGWFEVEPEAKRSALLARIHFPKVGLLPKAVDRIRSMFDLSADPKMIGEHLRADPMLASRIERRPGLRIPGVWSFFEMGVRAVLGQQVSAKGASTLAGRLAERWGEPTELRQFRRLFPRPEALADADLESAGLTRARSRTIRAFAAAVAAGTLPLDRAADFEEVRRRLEEIPGIGPWTSQYVTMRASGDPDAFPPGDLGLRRAFAGADGELVRAAERWRPWRAYAALHLWTPGEIR